MSKRFAEYKGLDLTQASKEILEQWKREDAFRNCLKEREGHPNYVFYDGPPSANGKPGIHHVMARTIKDAFCRYKTQKGFRVERKAGWDTHGLPVELGVEKLLGITKEDIGGKISVDEYNAACRKEVMKYIDLWADLTDKMGYWVDMADPYITYDNRYIESLWWLLKRLYDKGLLYKGYTIQPYSPAAGTGLSSHELNQPGCYRDVKDTTVTAQFAIVRDAKSENLYSLAAGLPVFFLAWTTTPWTLPSNTALCVGEKIVYQFGLTMAIAIGFSALNALTLSPALCAILLKPHKKEEETTLKERLGTAYKAAAETYAEGYKGAFARIMKPGVIITLIVIAILGMIFGGFNFTGHPIIAAIITIIAVTAVIGLSTKMFQKKFNETYDRILQKYKKAVLYFIQHRVLSLSITGGFIALLIWLMSVTPTAMVPNEDTGTIMGVVTMPAGTSQDRTDAYLQRVDSLVRSVPCVELSTMISGYSFIGGQGPSYGSFIIKLKKWEERGMTESSTIVFANLYLRAREVFKDAQVLFFQPPMVTGYGATNGFTLNLQDRTGGDLNKFYEVAKTFLADLEKRPEIESAQTNFSPNFPQYLIDIDAAKCKRAGISPKTILTTLQGYYGGLYSSNFNRFGKIYRVMVQGERKDRTNIESLHKIKIKNGNEMAPITEFMTITPTFGPDNINRFNMYTAISVNGNPASGYTSGQAIKAIEEVAAQSLPQGYSFEFSGQSREEQKSAGSTTAIVFLLCFVFIYLLLSAQYESYVLPLAVLLSVPFGLAGSFIFIQLFGSLSYLPGMLGSFMGMIFGSASNNIYVQIALIMLMGLLAKNAILIVEFALDRRKMGMSITWAAVLGAGARLRPILMTSLAMIIGLLPLMFASGVGANGNHSLGITAIGGMLIGMIFQIFIVPVLFVVFQYLQEKVKPMVWEDIDNTDAQADIEQYSK